MKRLLTYTFSSKNAHVIRLLGAFVLFAGLLMFFKAGADMFETWDNVKVVNQCLVNTGSDLTIITACQNTAKDALNVYTRINQETLTFKQLFSVLAPTIAALFAWISVILIGFAVYSSIRVSVPIEENVRDLKRK